MTIVTIRVGGMMDEIIAGGADLEVQMYVIQNLMDG